jgi:glycosyltransferase involved in cell wall biosynthesis
MIALIGMGYEVHFVGSVEVFNGSNCYIDDLRSRGIITHVQQYKHHVAHILEKIIPDIDICFISRYDNWNKFYNFILNISDHISFVFDTVDLHHIRYQREADLGLLGSKDSLEVNAIEKAEMTAITQADNVLIRSTFEFDHLVNRSIDRKKLHLFPICRDIIPSSVGFDDRNGFLFLGGFLHSPNIDAVKFFLEKIFPEVRRLDSSLKFYIVGSHSELLIDSLGNDFHSDGVEVIGYVSDLRLVFDQVKFSVAPLRFGAGTKGKVISSMCHGLPCIATSVAVEGLRDLKNGYHVLIENEPSAFAEKIVNLHSNSKLWQDLSSNSVDYASQTSSLDTLNSCIKDIMENAAN